MSFFLNPNFYPWVFALFLFQGISAQNLVDTSTWSAGNTPPSNHVFWTTGENNLVTRTDPHGNPNVVMLSLTGNGDGSDGGLTQNSPGITIDHTKTYRFTIWIKRGATSGHFLHMGVRAFDSGGNPVTQGLDGSDKGYNAWMVKGDVPEASKWYLMVGYLRPSNYPLNGVDESGLYNKETGQKESTVSSDLKTTSGAVSIRYIYGQYANPNSGEEVLFFDPQIYDTSDSTMPSIVSLLNPGSNGSGNGTGEGTDNGSSTGGETNNNLWSSNGTSIHYSNGNVGIGTVTPARTLHIHNGNSGFAPHSYSDLVIEDDDHVMVSLMSGNAKNGYYGFADSSDDYVGGMQYVHSSDKMLFRVNNHSMGDLVIDKNGNVGIGDQTPTNKLEVNGSMNATEYITVSKNGSYRVGMNGQGHGYIIGRNDNSENKFQVHSNGPTWFNGGNVGIGTNTPDSKLAVNGNIRAKEIKVETANWPDYVFETGYDLPSLEEIKKHIQENGHLPNIPSAKEIEANGVELGEMNRLLLEKIEELTLHLIEKDERLNNLSQRLEELEKRYEPK